MPSLSRLALTIHLECLELPGLWGFILTGHLGVYKKQNSSLGHTQSFQFLVWGCNMHSDSGTYCLDIIIVHCPGNYELQSTLPCLAGFC